jgi:hypothetical protein
MWKQHFSICAVLALLAIPVYFADMYLLKSRGGGWIALNMQGLIIVPYIAFAALHICVSSLALFQFSSSRLLSLHVVSGILSLGLLVGGFVVYTRLERARNAEDYRKRMEIVEQLRKVIELRRWWYVPNADAPKELHVRVKVNESGRFSGNAQGRAGGNLGELIFNTVDVPQRQAGKGEEFTHIFPLNFLKEGKADDVSISLYLFKDQTGSAPENVTIVFEDKPASRYDGHFIYEQIPPRSPQE